MRVDQFLFRRRDGGTKERRELQTLLDGRRGDAERWKATPGSRLRSQAKIWWVCIERDAHSHTCRNKPFLGKTRRFPELERGPESRSEVPTVLPAGVQSPSRRFPTRSRHDLSPPGSCLTECSLSASRPLPPSSAHQDPEPGREEEVPILPPAAREPRRQAPWEWGAEGGAGTPVAGAARCKVTQHLPERAARGDRPPPPQHGLPQLG